MAQALDLGDDERSTRPEISTHLCGQQGLGICLQLVQIAVLPGQAVTAAAVTAGASKGGGSDGGWSDSVGGGGHWMRGTVISTALRFRGAAVQRRATLRRRKPLPPGL